MQGNPPEWAQYALPDARGHFGPYGGVFVAETLRAALDELTLAYSRLREDPEFRKELAWELEHYVGRPSPIYHARRLSQSFEDIDFSDARKQVPHAAPLSLTAPVDYALVDEIQNTVR